MKALQLAMKKAGKLPIAAQEQIGLEMLMRINSLAQLRKEIDLGLRELRAGKGVPFDREKILAQARKRHG